MKKKIRDSPNDKSTPSYIQILNELEINKRYDYTYLHIDLNHSLEVITKVI